MAKFLTGGTSELPGDGTTFEDPETRRRFVQAALLANDVWGDRIYASGLNVTDDPATDRQRAAATLRQAIGSNASGLELQRVLARGGAIYDKHFARHFPTAREDFQQATGLELEHYPLCVSVFMIDFCKVDLENVDKQPGILTVATVASTVPPDAAEAIAKFCALESQTPDELRAALLSNGAVPDAGAHFDHKPLRARPMLRTADGRAIIIDPRYFGEKLVVGPLFRLAQFHARDKPLTNQLFTAFGNSFETYVQDLLTCIGKTAQKLWLNPSRQILRNRVELTDGAIRFGPDLLAVEAKGVFIPETAFQGNDVSTYLSQVRKKYSKEESPDGSTRPRGVGQLAHAVSLMVRDGFLDEQGDLDEVARVFPILVVHDPLLCTPGHAEFLGDEFVQALEFECERGIGYIQHGRFLIAPLTIMSIDDVEDLESSAENFRLDEFLAEYCLQGQAGARPTLHDFMAAVQDRYRFIHSRELATRGLAKLDSVRRFFYPSSPE
jgi:hypothetical protein